MRQTDPILEPGFGVIQAAVTSLVRPVTAVKRADHLPWWQAWIVHVIGMFGLAFVIWVLGALDSVRYSASFMEAIIDLPGEMIELTHEAVEELDQPIIWVAMFFTAVFTEVSWVVSAAVAMSWSAEDEPWLKSYIRALRRLWLLTPHLGSIVLVCGLVITWAERVYWGYNAFLDMDVLINVWAVAAASLWSLWIVLSALGCRRPTAMCRWPAGCIHCGYQLLGLDHDQNCPECGRAIHDTLDKQARPGITQLGWFKWWIGLTCRSVRKPTWLGQTMHVLSPDPGHRRCLGMSAAAIMLISPIALGGVYAILGIVLSYLNNVSYYNVRDGLRAALVAGTWMGLLITATMVGSALLCATVIGLIEGYRSGRNLMPAAVQAAGYQSGFTLLWTVVFWANMVLFVTVMELELLQRFATRFNLDSELLVMLWLGGVILLGISIYASLIAKATRAARYANW